MGKIKLLDEVTANQIAAGEVVERPASVVKELIENSLDAKATQIDVFIEDGGLKRIRIVDNGEGMNAEDAVLCLSRYATSKISEAKDLSDLHTFGFRGEAIPSIASVSKLRIMTRQQGGNTATEVRAEGGKISSVEDAGAPVGTQIDVEDLFFNTPARLKFLKSIRSEAAAVETVIRAAALSSPHVGFKLHIDGRKVLDVRQAPKDADLTHQRRTERAIACLGEEVRDYMYPLSQKNDWVSISGYIVAPLVTRRDGKGIRLFVNGRPVEDKLLSQAVKVAFRTLLEVGRLPICALNIEVNPQIVDVNVHPQKAEVRFSDARRVQGSLIRILGDFLATTPWLKKKYASPQSSSPSHSYYCQEAVPLTSYQTPVFLTDSSPVTTHTHHHVPVTTQMGLQAAVTFSSLRIVGQVDNTYLIFEGPKALIIVDQHAAHERVTFEKLKSQAKQGRVLSQPLLFPIQMRLQPEQMAALHDRGQELLRFGFDVEEFGESQAIIKAVPAMLSIEKAESLTREALSGLEESGRADALDEMIDKICAQIACHGSIRAGQKLHADEITALVKQMDHIELSAHCPHGRPVVRSIPYDDMAKWFNRC